MDRRLLWLVAGSAALLAALAVVGPWDAGVQARAGDVIRRSIPDDLFHNYYAPPGYGGQSAELYLCPRPTPPLVGHTYITYQPLYPHEFLYQHHRTYVRVNPDGGRTKAKVHWR